MSDRKICACKTAVALRPHHGLCLGFFEGKGYSSGFCGNMAAVLDGLHPDTPVRLEAGQDCICRNCPNRGTKCPNAAVYDSRVLVLCGLRTGQVLPWGQLQEAVRRRIVRTGRLASVCGDCEWADLCRAKSYRMTGM